MRRAWVSVAALLSAAASAEIQLNQLGFLPGAAKLAVVAGPSGNSFDVVDDANGRLAYRGPMSLSSVWEPAGTAQRVAQFSALQRPGTYRIKVAGQPDSPPFVIAADAYAALNAASIKALYFNRAGTALAPEHAGVYARPAGHADTVVRVHASAADARQPGRSEGTVISSPKGWYDAGDYNKYIVNSGITTYTLLAAYEHFPAFFQQQNLNIPESGKGLPDLLAEVKWNLDWMLSMQDPADGGVYHKLTDKSFDGMVMPHVSNAERYVVQKSTAAALNFAAVMAAASRVYKDAALLAAAESAWRWAQAHPAVIYRQPPDIKTGEYGDDKLADEFAWAAAELLITTAKPEYRAALKLEQQTIAVPSWGDVRGLAWMSLAQHRHKLDAGEQALVSQRVKGLARKLVEQHGASPQRLAMQAVDFVWGSNAVALNQGLMLIQGYRLTKERPMLDAAQSALDYVLGRNPLGLSMVTGFGTRSPQHPHHRPSEADGVKAPVPGFIVGGPNPGQQDAKDCPLAYPSKLPALAFIDHVCSYAANEVAINWNAPLSYLSAAVQVLTPKP